MEQDSSHGNRLAEFDFLYGAMGLALAIALVCERDVWRWQVPKAGEILSTIFLK